MKYILLFKWYNKRLINGVHVSLPLKVLRYYAVSILSLLKYDPGAQKQSLVAGVYL